jgi:hypothetical protein
MATPHSTYYSLNREITQSSPFVILSSFPDSFNKVAIQNGRTYKFKPFSKTPTFINISTINRLTVDVSKNKHYNCFTFKALIVIDKVYGGQEVLTATLSISEEIIEALARSGFDIIKEALSRIMTQLNREVEAQFIYHIPNIVVNYETNCGTTVSELFIIKYDLEDVKRISEFLPSSLKFESISINGRNSGTEDTFNLLKLTTIYEVWWRHLNINNLASNDNSSRANTFILSNPIEKLDDNPSNQLELF